MIDKKEVLKISKLSRLSIEDEKIDSFIKSRQDNAKKYYSELESLGDFFSFQITTKDAENSHFGFPMVLKNNTYFNRVMQLGKNPKNIYQI